MLIAGPTAGGKSALALDMAAKLDGVIVNTDSMQGYGMLQILTARPGAADLSRAPHALYGHVHPSTPYSTGAWLRDVMRLIDKGVFEGRTAIFVGGTGLYFRALLGGLSEMPEIPPHVRERWRYRLLEDGAERLHRILLTEDPEAAALLRPSDGQRIARALEVLEASGKSILKWQSEQGRPLVHAGSAKKIIVEPDREILRARIGVRFDRMVEDGAADEVRKLQALKLDSALPIMKAIGVRELAAAAEGKMSMDEAVAHAKIATAQYAKRQSTWFRNQFDENWIRIPAA